MNDKQKIEILEKFFGKGKYFASQSEVMFFCPFCEHYKRKLSINLQTLRWHCWVCGKKGRSLRPLLKKHCSKEEIKNIHKLFLNIENNEKNVDQIEEIKLELPKGWVPLSECKNSAIGKRMHDYLLNKRKIEEKDILQYKLGISLEDKQFENRIIFPSFDKNGELNFFIGRTIFDGKMKYLCSKNEKNGIIINELNLDFSKPVTIVEGFFDLLKCNGNATFLSGNDLSYNSKLFEEIVRNNAKVYLALDSDAKDKAIKIAKKLYRNGIEVYLVDILLYKDPGNMTKEQFVDRYNKAKLFEYSDAIRNRMNVVLN